MSAWVPVVVALITGPMMWLLVRFDKRNTQQHADNTKVLRTIFEAQAELKDDVRIVKTDVAAVKMDVAAVKTDIIEMRTDHRRMTDGAKLLSERLRLLEHPRN